MLKSDLNTGEAESDLTQTTNEPSGDADTAKHTYLKGEKKDLLLKKINTLRLRGHYAHEIADMCGVSRATIHNWLKIAREKMADELRNTSITDLISDSMEFYKWLKREYLKLLATDLKPSERVKALKGLQAVEKNIEGVYQNSRAYQEMMCLVFYMRLSDEDKRLLMEMKAGLLEAHMK